MRLAHLGGSWPAERGRFRARRIAQRLEPLQALGFTDIHPAILGIPFLNYQIADAALAAQIGEGNHKIALFKNDMVFGKSATFNLWLFKLD